MRQHNDQQKLSSTRNRNSNGVYIDSQGNSIPLSPVSSNTSSSSDNIEHQQKPVSLSPSGRLQLIYELLDKCSSFIASFSRLM